MEEAYNYLRNGRFLRARDPKHLEVDDDRYVYDFVDLGTFGSVYSARLEKTHPDAIEFLHRSTVLCTKWASRLCRTQNQKEEFTAEADGKRVRVETIFQSTELMNAIGTTTNELLIKPFYHECLDGTVRTVGELEIITFMGGTNFHLSDGWIGNHFTPHVRISDFTQDELSKPLRLFGCDTEINPDLITQESLVPYFILLDSHVQSKDLFTTSTQTDIQRRVRQAAESRSGNDPIHAQEKDGVYNPFSTRQVQELRQILDSVDRIMSMLQLKIGR